MVYVRSVSRRVGENGVSTRSLSTESVVGAALRLASSDGLDAVSLGRVARDLGCHVTSLYTHVDSIDDLRIRMGLTVQAELAQELWQAALGRSGVEALRGLADVYRAFGKREPVSIRLLYAMTSTADARFEEGARHLAEPIRATLRGFDLDETQVLHAHRAFSASMRGFLLAEAQGLYNADADVTFDQIVALFTRTLVSGEWPERKAA
jgi:AcrR family transcriptional regulator